jgi:hypothetical protein
MPISTFRPRADGIKRVSFRAVTLCFESVMPDNADASHQACKAKPDGTRRVSLSAYDDTESCRRTCLFEATSG